MALMKRGRSHLVWEAWTDFGSVGAYRTAILTQIDNLQVVPTITSQNRKNYVSSVTLSHNTCMYSVHAD